MFRSWRNRHGYAALLLAGILLPAGASALTSGTGDDALLAIDAGRLLAMTDQIAVLLKVGDAREPAAESPAATLDTAVMRYEWLRPIACGRHAIDGPSCADAYAPPPSAASGPALRRALDEADAHIRPFWEAVCLKLDSPDHAVCQME